MAYGEASLLILELMKETGSHLSAELRGMDLFVASNADLALALIAESYINVHTDPKKSRKPFTFPRPWGAKTETVSAPVTDEERAEYRALLAARSAFAD